MTSVKMAPARRRPRRVAKRIAKRRGASTFAGGEVLGRFERQRKFAIIGRGAAHMCMAAASMLRFDYVGQVAHVEVGTSLLAGDETTARKLDRFTAMGHARPERSVAAVMRWRRRREAASHG